MAEAWVRSGPCHSGVTAGRAWQCWAVQGACCREGTDVQAWSEVECGQGLKVWAWGALGHGPGSSTACRVPGANYVNSVPRFLLGAHQQGNLSLGAMLKEFFQAYTCKNLKQMQRMT